MKEKMSVLWFTEDDWLEAFSREDERCFGQAFSKVLDLKKDYDTIGTTTINQIIQNLYDHLDYLVDETKKNSKELPPFCFELYTSKLLNVTVKHKRLGNQRHISDVENMILTLEALQKESKPICYHTIDLAVTEALGTLCMKIVKRNLRLSTLSETVLNQLVEHRLLEQKEGAFCQTNKIKVLFGR